MPFWPDRCRFPSQTTASSSTLIRARTALSMTMLEITTLAVAVVRRAALARVTTMSRSENKNRRWENQSLHFEPVLRAETPEAAADDFKNVNLRKIGTLYLMEIDPGSVRRAVCQWYGAVKIPKLFCILRTPDSSLSKVLYYSAECCEQ